MNFFKYSSLDYPILGQLGFQSSASPIMRGIIDLHHHIMFFLIFILVFTFCMLYYTLENYTVLTGNKFLAFFKTKKLYNINITHYTFLETIWIIIPSLILLSIVLPSFALLYAMDITKDCLLAMKVIGHQWYWSYEFSFYLSKINNYFCWYIGQKEIFNHLNRFAEFGFDSYMVPAEDLSENSLRLLETTNPVILPYKTYIKVCVTASDVIHSWAVPSLGIKIDALPGRLNQVMLYIDRLGRYYGQCSELCGVNHGFMPIEIYGVSKIDYLVYLTYACEDFRNHHKILCIYIDINHYTDLIAICAIIIKKKTNLVFNDNDIHNIIKKNFSNWSNDAFKDVVKNKSMLKW